MMRCMQGGGDDGRGGVGEGGEGETSERWMERKETRSWSSNTGSRSLPAGRRAKSPPCPVTLVLAGGDK